MIVTLWDNVSSPKGQRLDVPWSDLPALLALLSPMALWSPGEYRDDYHDEEHFVRAYAIVLDHDAATIPVKDVPSLLDGVRAYVHETKTKGRWRAIIESEPMGIDAYRQTVKPLAQALDCAHESWSPFQMWFPPRGKIREVVPARTRLDCWIDGDYQNALVVDDLPLHPGKSSVDRSNIDMRIAHAMVAKGETDETIAATLLARGELSHRLDIGYFNMTIGKARKRQEEEREWALRDMSPESIERAAEVPNIRIGPDLDRVADECALVLATRPGVYTRAESLVSVANGETHLLTPARVADELSAGAVFLKATKDGDRACEPPERVCKILVDRKEHASRPIRVIAPFPIVRPDGTVNREPGYDAVTESLFTGPAVDSIEMSPERALNALREPFLQFPFEHAGQIDVIVSLILSVVCRQTVKGNVPLFVLDASRRGAGKSLLATCVSLITLGEHVHFQSWPDSKDGAELDKRLSAIAFSSAPYVAFDEAQVVGGGPLNSLLTCNGKHAFRRLGRSERVTAEWLTVLAVCANNICVQGDTQRRAIACRLTPGAEAIVPRLNLHRWIPENRARLLGAALSLVQPRIGATDGPRMASFEQWASIIAGAIVSAGGHDVTQYCVREEAEESQEHDQIVTWIAMRWPDGATARNITDDLGGGMGMSSEPAKKLMAETGIDARKLAKDARELGLALRNWRQVRTKEGLYLDREGTPPRWIVKGD